MPERLIERGIGETRFVLVEDGAIVEARILRDGIVPAGTILAARLVAHRPQSPSRAPAAQEYLLPKGAPGVTEGATLNIEVTREALAGAEPWKRPLARVSDAAPAEAPAIDWPHAGLARRRPTRSRRWAGPTCSTRRAAASSPLPAASCACR